MLQGAQQTRLRPYRAVEMEELSYALLPEYKDGTELGELSNMELSGFLQKVDQAFVDEQLI